MTNNKKKKYSTFNQPKTHIEKTSDKLVKQSEKNDKLKDKPIKVDLFKLFK